MSASHQGYEHEAYCTRCKLIVKVPQGGRNIFRLGSCPSCDMVSWADAAPQVIASWDAQTRILMKDGIRITDPEIVLEVSNPAEARKREREANKREREAR